MNPGTREVGFFFLRHGETVANRDGVRSGSECNAYLTRRGRTQADTAGLALSLSEKLPGMIVSSALSRTLTTARVLNKWLKLDIRVEKELNERLLGDWNGRSVSETQPALASGETPPGGESSAQFRARVLTALHNLAPLYPNWPLIVSSRGIARVLLEYASDAQGAGVTSVPNGMVLRVTLASADDFKVVKLEHIQGNHKKLCRCPVRTTCQLSDLSAPSSVSWMPMILSKPLTSKIAAMEDLSAHSTNLVSLFCSDLATNRITRKPALLMYVNSLRFITTALSLSEISSVSAV